MSKYHKQIAANSKGESDVYDVLRAFGVTDPAIAHGIKKLLMPGLRGDKSQEQDLREAIMSIERALPEVVPEQNHDHDKAGTAYGSRNVMTMRGGTEFFFDEKPTPEMISIHAFKHHLQRINRFSGGTDCSVWTHGYNAWALASTQNLPLHLRRWAFIHDWHEAVVGDDIRPKKLEFGHSPKLTAYIEKLDQAIFTALYGKAVSSKTTMVSAKEAQACKRLDYELMLIENLQYGMGIDLEEISRTEGFTYDMNPQAAQLMTLAKDLRLSGQVTAEIVGEF